MSNGLECFKAMIIIISFVEGEILNGTIHPSVYAHDIDDEIG